MNKGQIIAGDFMISIAVFVIILMMILPVWYYLSTQVGNSGDRRNIELLSVTVSDVLTKTQGYPENWNATTVKTLGLADEEENMNLSKAMEMEKLDYMSTKKILGIGNYNFYIAFYDDGYNLTSGMARSPVAYFANSEIEIRDMLNYSGAVWDFYKAGAATYYGDARKFYNDTKVNAFNAMVGNQSDYMTIIIEDPELRGDEIEIDKLKEFVKLGGIIIYKGAGWNNGIILEDFGMNSHEDSETDGIVTNKSIILNSTVGENITFSDSQWSFSQYENNNLNIIVAEQADNSRCLVCEWEYWYGSIYYFADVEGTIQNGADTRDLKNNTNIVGKRIEYGFSPPGSADFVMKIQRLIPLKKNDMMIVIMELVLWL